MATFAQLKSRVSRRAGLSETAAGQDDDLLSMYLNDAVREFLLETKLNVNRASISVSAETDDSDLSTNILQITDLYVTGTDTRQVTPIQVDPETILHYRRLAPTSGITTRLYAMQGSHMVMWYPSLAAGTTLTIYYVALPTEMSSGSHDPSNETYGGIPKEYHPVLEEYAVWKMLDYDDNPKRSQQAEERYERMLVKARSRIRGVGGSSLGRIPHIGQVPAYPADNSTDVGW